MRESGRKINNQCPMPYAQCSMPNAQCPIPNTQCPEKTNCVSLSKHQSSHFVCS
ncbi:MULTISPECIES: hypothetical protein [unclassified Nostoc]|uniref:hypothetical protein n=1 Tax=unclassified Nostoc TaxID=2593658 RepID=UPI0026102746|nr:hypothetical protein [Nostoc sp. S13]MDF5739046.1 hypothetical protein [Nostoc sp. S13]